MRWAISPANQITILLNKTKPKTLLLVTPNTTHHTYNTTQNMTCAGGVRVKVRNLTAPPSPPIMHPGEPALSISDWGGDTHTN